MRACSTATPCCLCSMTTHVPVGRFLPVWRRRVAWASTFQFTSDDLDGGPGGTVWDQSGRAQGARLGRHGCGAAVAHGRAGDSAWPAAKLRWQATYGNGSAWVVCPTGSRPWWSPARGCFASLVAIDPLSRTPRAGLRQHGAAEAGIGPGCRADECRCSLRTWASPTARSSSS